MQRRLTVGGTLKSQRAQANLKGTATTHFQLIISKWECEDQEIKKNPEPEFWGELSQISMLATNTTSLKQENWQNMSVGWIQHTVIILSCLIWTNPERADSTALMGDWFSVPPGPFSFPLVLEWVLFSLVPLASLGEECTVSCPQRLHQVFKTFYTYHLASFLDFSGSGVHGSTIFSTHVVACSMSYLSRLLLPKGETWLLFANLQIHSLVRDWSIGTCPPLHLVIPTRHRKTWLLLFPWAIFSSDTSPWVPASELKGTSRLLMYCN